jgi:serine protease Do
MNKLLAVGCSVAVLCLVAAPMGAAQAGREGTDILRQTSAAFTSVARQAVPAVVFIQVEKTVTMGGGPDQEFEFNNPFEFFGGDDFMNRFFFGTPRQRRAPLQPRRFMQVGQGSGFIISDDGYIMSNHHVVGDADKITVRLGDGRQFEAKRIGTDRKSEVAIIKIDAKGLPFLKFGDSDALEIGEWIIAVGNPFGLSETVTAGIVSAKGRSGMGIADYESFIQTDAAINPGNSGGPLLDLDGHVVGINTAIYSRSGGSMGIGFAIPANMALQIKEQLVKTGKVSRGYLGIVIQELTPELRESFKAQGREGILVSDVTKDSPAEKGGVKQGDIITTLEGKPVHDVGSFRNQIASFGPDSKLDLGILREGREENLRVTTGALPDEVAAGKEAAPQSELLGMSVQELTPELAQRLGYEGGEGVVVSDVKEGGNAWRAGIEQGNIIAGVNRRRVTSVREFNRAVAEASGSKTLLLQVRNEQGARFVVLRWE